MLLTVITQLYEDPQTAFCESLFSVTQK